MEFSEIKCDLDLYMKLSDKKYELDLYIEISDNKCELDLFIEQEINPNDFKSPILSTMYKHSRFTVKQRMVEKR